MRLKKSSWVVKWAYLGEGRNIPASTSLCALFWRCVALTPLKTFFVAFVTFGVGFIGYKAVMNPLNTLIALVIVGMIPLLSKLDDWDTKRKVEGVKPWRSSNNVMVQTYFAVKDKVCPLIDLVGPKEEE